MELSGFDCDTPAPNNEGVVQTDRVRIGRKLRALRVEAGKYQIEIAQALKIHVKTLQAIENAWYEVKDSNIERYARYFHTSLTKLLVSETKPPSLAHPLLKDLNDEHLEIAHAYMKARRRTRQGIELLLRLPATEALSGLLLGLETADDRTIALIALALKDDASRQLFFQFLSRYFIDPAFAQEIRDKLILLDQVDSSASPPARRSHPPRRKKGGAA